LAIKTLHLDLDPNPDPHWELDPDPQIDKMLDPDPDPDSHEINADPQPCWMDTREY
jgi:hypothetical protein